jgi:hypothetical protein
MISAAAAAISLGLIPNKSPPASLRELRMDPQS